ncbi:hypothetical protein BCR33DRAFT_717823 [Rhizoclosmatium globosum]|uniref:Uncharacterized protein n=1 Tax=Rhizoclosmatium globosum TaxID=329046 RepID=A0A1Y2C7T5_9FUNG|nr:hypothetical protein BCR33DRAFT_717823 [Rhizoclosmatium globosum]|eukprot:ORY43089.1 hypothetical protein BCR33DRAFT_717823 [Rhizoclosmatium globosum]
MPETVILNFRQHLTGDQLANSCLYFGLPSDPDILEKIRNCKDQINLLRQNPNRTPQLCLDLIPQCFGGFQSQSRANILEQHRVSTLFSADDVRISGVLYLAECAVKNLLGLGRLSFSGSPFAAASDAACKVAGVLVLNRYTEEGSLNLLFDQELAALQGVSTVIIEDSEEARAACNQNRFQVCKTGPSGCVPFAPCAPAAPCVASVPCDSVSGIPNLALPTALPTHIAFYPEKDGPPAFFNTVSNSTTWTNQLSYAMWSPDAQHFAFVNSAKEVEWDTATNLYSPNLPKSDFPPPHAFAPRPPRFDLPPFPQIKPVPYAELSGEDCNQADILWQIDHCVLELNLIARQCYLHIDDCQVIGSVAASHVEIAPFYSQPEGAKNPLELKHNTSTLLPDCRIGSSLHPSGATQQAPGYFCPNKSFSSSLNPPTLKPHLLANFFKLVSSSYICGPLFRALNQIAAVDVEKVFAAAKGDACLKWWVCNARTFKSLLSEALSIKEAFNKVQKAKVVVDSSSLFSFPPRMPLIATLDEMKAGNCQCGIANHKRSTSSSCLFQYNHQLEEFTHPLWTKVEQWKAANSGNPIVAYLIPSVNRKNPNYQSVLDLKESRFYFEQILQPMLTEWIEAGRPETHAKMPKTDSFTVKTSYSSFVPLGGCLDIQLKKNLPRFALIRFIVPRFATNVALRMYEESKQSESAPMLPCNSNFYRTVLVMVASDGNLKQPTKGSHPKLGAWFKDFKRDASVPAIHPVDTTDFANTLVHISEQLAADFLRHITIHTGNRITHTLFLIIRSVLRNHGIFVVDWKELGNLCKYYTAKFKVNDKKEFAKARKKGHHSLPPLPKWKHDATYDNQKILDFIGEQSQDAAEEIMRYMGDFFELVEFQFQGMLPLCNRNFKLHGIKYQQGHFWLAEMRELYDPVNIATSKGNPSLTIPPVFYYNKIIRDIVKRPLSLAQMNVLGHEFRRGVLSGLSHPNKTDPFYNKMFFRARGVVSVADVEEIDKLNAAIMDCISRIQQKDFRVGTFGTLPQGVTKGWHTNPQSSFKPLSLPIDTKTMAMLAVKYSTGNERDRVLNALELPPNTNQSTFVSSAIWKKPELWGALCNFDKNTLKKFGGSINISESDVSITCLRPKVATPDTGKTTAETISLPPEGLEFAFDKGIITPFYVHVQARPGSGAGLGPNQVPNGPTKAPVVDPVTNTPRLSKSQRKNRNRHARNLAIKEGTFVFSAPEHPSAERRQEIIKKAALDKQRKKARYSHNRQTRTLAQLKERKEQFGRFAYEKLSPEEKARGMGFPLRNEEFRNLANMDMAEVLRKEICSAYEMELNGVNMDGKTEARIAKFNAIIDDKKSQIKVTISDKIKSIQSGKTAIVQLYNNACATSFAAFPVLHELYLRQDFLQMMVYRGQQRALKVFMGYIHGNLDPKLVTCVFGSAEFSQQMKGTVSGCGGRLLKEMKKRFRWINVDEFKSTMNPGCCWGTGFKGGKIDLGPCSCDFEVEQELAKLTEELLAGKDLNELLTQRDDGTFLHLAQIEALLKSLGADESFGVDETEQFDHSKFFTQKDADHHGEGEEENGRYGDDKGEFGEDGEDLRESLTTVEEGDGVEEEDDSDPMDLEESETAPVSVTVESKSLAVESDIMEDVLEEGELATSGDTSTSMEVEEELWSAALDTLLQSLSAPASTDGLDPEGIYAIHVTHPSEIWKREGVGDVYPEDVRRIPLTNSVARAKSKTILKHSKAFRPGWKEHLPLVERVKLAFHAGVPVGSPLRGLKYCHHCGTMWDRDRNAARNIWMCFWYMRLNGLKRPFTMQRKKSV